MLKLGILPNNTKNEEKYQKEDNVKVSKIGNQDVSHVSKNKFLGKYQDNFNSNINQSNVNQSNTNQVNKGKRRFELNDIQISNTKELHLNNGNKLYEDDNISVISNISYKSNMKNVEHKILIEKMFSKLEKDKKKANPIIKEGDAEKQNELLSRSNPKKPRLNMDHIINDNEEVLKDQMISDKKKWNLNVSNEEIQGFRQLRSTNEDAKIMLDNFKNQQNNEKEKNDSKTEKDKSNKKKKK